MKRKTRKVFMFVFVIIFIIYGICVVKVNNMYPQSKEKIFLLNQIFSYQEVEVSIVDFGIMNDEDTEKYYAKEIENYGSCIGINVEILIKNNSEITQEIDLTPLIFESGAWKNAIHYLAFTKLNADNEKMSLHPELEPNESIKLILPTFVLPIHMRGNQWENFLNRELYVTFSLYPEKIMVKLQ